VSAACLLLPASFPIGNGVVLSEAADDVPPPAAPGASDASAEGGKSVKKKKKRRKKKKKKKRKKDEDDVPSVSVTRYEYCHACVATVEEFHHAVEEFAHSREFRRQKGDEIDGTKIARELCNGTRFQHYTDQMKHGCMKLQQDHWNLVIGGMAGHRSAGSRSPILEHKRRACVETEACIGHMAEKITKRVLKEKTPCNACKAIVTDIDDLLFREKAPVPRRVRMAELLNGICGDVAIRHDDSAYLEEMCDDLIDKMIGDTLEEEQSILVRSIKLRKSLEGGGLKLSISLQEKVCAELAGYCTAEDAKPDEPKSDSDAEEENEEEEEEERKDL